MFKLNVKSFDFIEIFLLLLSIFFLILSLQWKKCVNGKNIVLESNNMRETRIQNNPFIIQYTWIERI